MLLRVAGNLEEWETMRELGYSELDIRRFREMARALKQSQEEVPEEWGRSLKADDAYALLD